MTAETERTWRKRSRTGTPAAVRRLGSARRSTKRPTSFGFSTLSRRIVVLNLCALLVLLSGFLFMNQFREGLIDARVQSLLTQGEIIAAAIAASATVDSDAGGINPERLLELEAGQSLSPGGDDLDLLARTARQVAAAMQRVPGAADVQAERLLATIGSL